MCARVASIISPLILVLSDYWGPLPIVIFGALSVIAGCLILLLPETVGTKLPQTIEEGELFGTYVILIYSDIKLQNYFCWDFEEIGDLRIF